MEVSVTPVPAPAVPEVPLFSVVPQAATSATAVSAAANLVLFAMGSELPCRSILTLV
jgi:hypothetical protein